MEYDVSININVNSTVYSNGAYQDTIHKTVRVTSLYHLSKLLGKILSHLSAEDKK